MEREPAGYASVSDAFFDDTRRWPSVFITSCVKLVTIPQLRAWTTLDGSEMRITNRTLYRINQLIHGNIVSSPDLLDSAFPNLNQKCYAVSKSLVQEAIKQPGITLTMTYAGRWPHDRGQKSESVHQCIDAQERHCNERAPKIVIILRRQFCSRRRPVSLWLFIAFCSMVLIAIQ